MFSEPFDNTNDVILIGSVKTLVPTVKFGRNDIFFKVWVFIFTPKGLQFPVKFYYGPSGLAIGSWNIERIKNYFDSSFSFPDKFTSIVNCNPFSLSKLVLKEVTIALEEALKNIYASNFYGIHNHDLGYRFIGLKDQKPFIIDLGDSLDLNYLKVLLNDTLRLNIDLGEIENWSFL